ncbi:MAG: response regulator [Chloroflexi bacterium]|nr:response regulator [Chloroflexota bacterium]
MTAPNGAKVLVVDDETAILRAVRTVLMGHGWQVETAESGLQALERAAHGQPDVILLDLGLPDLDGLDVIREIRKRSATPIIVLSVRETERDKVAALDLGADDYLTKPFGVDELLARVRVALRHAAGPSGGAEAVFRTGDFTVDLGRRLVSVEGAEVHLTPNEFDLLKAFIRYPNRVLTDRMLLQQVWGPEYGSEEHYLHVYMARLRKKLEPDPRHPRYLTTVPGVGYRLLAQED